MTHIHEPCLHCVSFPVSVVVIKEYANMLLKLLRDIFWQKLIHPIPVCYRVRGLMRSAYYTPCRIRIRSETVHENNT